MKKGEGCQGKSLTFVDSKDSPGSQTLWGDFDFRIFERWFKVLKAKFNPTLTVYFLLEILPQLLYSWIKDELC